MVLDLAGGFVEFAADFAGLEGDLGLFERFAIGPSEAAHRGDIGQLAHAAGYLLEVGKGVGRPQVMR